MDTSEPLRGVPSNVRQRLILMAGVDGCANDVPVTHEGAQNSIPNPCHARHDDNTAPPYVSTLHGSPNVSA